MFLIDFDSIGLHHVQETARDQGFGMIQQICTFPPSQDFSHDEAIETLDFKQYSIIFGTFVRLVPRLHPRQQQQAPQRFLARCSHATHGFNLRCDVASSGRESKLVSDLHVFGI